MILLGNLLGIDTLSRLDSPLENQVQYQLMHLFIDSIGNNHSALLPAGPRAEASPLPQIIVFVKFHLFRLTDNLHIGVALHFGQKCLRHPDFIHMHGIVNPDNS